MEIGRHVGRVLQPARAGWRVGEPAPHMNIIVTILAFIIVTLAATTLYARSHPLEAFEKMTRGSLRRAGFTKHNVDGVVWFTGGRGERTLVLVHGVNDQAGTWSSVAPKLTRDFKVVAIDL